MQPFTKVYVLIEYIDKDLLDFTIESCIKGIFTTYSNARCKVEELGLEEWNIIEYNLEQKEGNWNMKKKVLKNWIANILSFIVGSYLMFILTTIDSIGNTTYNIILLIYSVLAFTSYYLLLKYTNRLE